MQKPTNADLRYTDWAIPTHIRYRIFLKNGCWMFINISYVCLIRCSFYKYYFYSLFKVIEMTRKQQRTYTYFWLQIDVFHLCRQQSCLSYSDYITCTSHYITRYTHTHTSTHAHRRHYTFSQLLFNQTNGASGHSFQNPISTMYVKCSLL
jgi:hypothetical protein